MYYLRARYMNPQAGRFLTQDSYEGNAYDPQSLHKYTFTANNPVNLIDPLGHFGLDEQMAALTVSTIIRAISVSAIAGAAIGGTRAALAGGSEGDIALGAGEGAIVGGGLAALLLLVPSMAPVLYALGAIGSALGVIQDVQQGNWKLATFDALLGVLSLSGARSLVSQLTPPPSKGVNVFYTVQSEAEFARLQAGGEPWPTGFDKSYLGEGLYAWQNQAEAEAYLNRLTQHIGTETSEKIGLKIRTFSIPDEHLGSVRQLDLRTRSDDDVNAWSETFTWNGPGNPPQQAHGYEYVIRRTGMGDEHYFAPSLFNKGSMGQQ